MGTWFSTLTVSALLASVVPAFAQSLPEAPAAAVDAEFQLLMNQSAKLADIEFARPYGQRNYKNVLAIAQKAERSAARQFGPDSNQYMRTLNFQAYLLGLAGQYDKQLQMARKLFAVETRKLDRRSVFYARSLVRLANNITYYHEPHAVIGKAALTEARAILLALGPVRTKDHSNVWYAYAVDGRLLLDNSESVAALVRVRDYMKSETPLDIDSYAAVLNWLASAYGWSKQDAPARQVWMEAVEVANADPRPEKKQLPQALLSYGAALIESDPINAQATLQRAVEEMIKRGDAIPAAKLNEARERLTEATLAADKVRTARRARIEVARRMAVEATASAAARNGTIVATPGLARALNALRGAGIILNSTGAAR